MSLEEEKSRPREEMYSKSSLTSQLVLDIVHMFIQLGQPSVNPPRLVLEVGGTSTLQAAMPVKLKSPPTSRFQVGGTSALQAWLPAKLKSPPLQAQVRGGSR